VQAVAQQVIQSAQQQLLDAVMGPDLSSHMDDNESIVDALSSSLSFRKRLVKTDSVFAESMDELWE
jgi:hypothetical protein